MVNIKLIKFSLYIACVITGLIIGCIGASKLEQWLRYDAEECLQRAEQWLLRHM